MDKITDINKAKNKNKKDEIKTITGSEFELIHAVPVEGFTIEEFHDNLNDILTHIQCELRGKIKDIKYVESGGEENTYFSALIIYYHTLMEIED